MSIHRVENLPEPLRYITTAYRTCDVRSPSRHKATSAQRANQLTSYLDLMQDEPQTVQKVHEATAELRHVPDLSSVLRALLSVALSLTAGEFGNIQLLDPNDNSLVLVTHSGLDAKFLEHFAVVDDSDSVCGRAAQRCAQTVVADVRDDPDMAPHQEIFRAAGVRAVQFTPLLDRVGQMVGMVSTHRPTPEPPSDRQLRIIGLLSQLTSDVIARHLGAAGSVAPGAGSPTATVPLPVAPSNDRVVAEAVNRIFAAGLNFAGALPLITDDHAAERVRTGIDELDATIRAIRLAVFNRSSPTRRPG